MSTLVDDRSAGRCGQLIAGNYELDRVLGTGVVGVVYAAHQRSLEREVAIKLPRPDRADDPEARHRLHVEALAASRIDHRNGVRVLDYGAHCGAPFIVMELLSGPRLAELLAEYGPLPPRLCVGIIRAVGDVLREAHARGIAHADVRCENVLVETQQDGTTRPRLIHWGGARFCDDRSDLADDVNAVGAMLCELVTGKRPAPGEQVSLAARRPDVAIPPALDAWLSRALATDPRRRFGDADELVRALPDEATWPQNAKPRRRASVLAALESRDGELIVASYLELARVLVADGQESQAIVELEGAFDLLSTPAASLHTAGPVWRLLMMLADLYGNRGDRCKAQVAARLARDRALRAGFADDCEQAEQLIARLTVPTRPRKTRPS